MIVLRSLVVQLVIYSACLFWGIVVTPFYFLSRRLALKALAAWGGSTLWFIRILGGIRIVEIGREHIPSGPCIIASKHQSILDTLAFTTLLADPAIVLKQELTWIPVFGWLLGKSRMIPIDRSGGSKALKTMLRAAEDAAKIGRPIVIFPQGTRTAPGVKRPYQAGTAALYRQLDLPVVPVALNSGQVWPRRSFLKYPGQMTIQYLPPIPPGLPKAVFMQRLETSIEDASDRLANKT